MFEDIIESKVKSIIASCNINVNKIYLNDIITNKKIDRACRVYINAERDWWIYNEKLFRTNNNNFDFRHPEFCDIFKQIDTIYEAIAKISYLDLLKLVEYSVNIRLNFLCKPRKTLYRFLTNDKEVISINEVLLRLNYFDDYNYFSSSIQQYFENQYEKYLASKPPDYKIKENYFWDNTITCDEILELIAITDKSHIKDLDFQSFLELLNPMIAFFNNNQKITETTSIPIEPVLYFLEDKSMTELQIYIKNKVSENNISIITKNELSNYINDFKADFETELSEDKESNIENEIIKLYHEN